MIFRMKNTAKILSFLVVLSVVFSQPMKADENPASAAIKLADGLYRVMRIATDTKHIAPVVSGEQLLTNDFHFLEPTERGATEYVVLQTEPFIPFLLAQAPAKDKDSQGKPKLFLQLSEDQVKPLEEFTRKNTGQKVAVVIGGEIVTVHKVREPIVGGRIQITRCTDNGCQAIFTEISKSTEDKSL